MKKLTSLIFKNAKATQAATKVTSAATPHSHSHNHNPSHSHPHPHPVAKMPPSMA